MKRLKISLVLLTLVCAGIAYAIPMDQVPNPKSSAGLWVQDQAQILGPAYIQLINNVAEQLHDKAGVEMALVTVDNLDGESVENYANTLFNRYGVGEAGKDNGILILIARDDRKTRIEVGYGLEAVINDAKAGRILDQTAIPWFHDNQFGRGLYETSKALAVEISGAIGSTLSVTDPATWPEQPTVTFEKAPLRKGVVVLVIMLVSILFGIPTILLLLWYGLRYALQKSPEKKLLAVSPNDSVEAAFLFMGPIVAGMIGYDQGNLWVGLIGAPIPIFFWWLVRKFRVRLAKPLLDAGVKLPKEEIEKRRKKLHSSSHGGGSRSSFGGGSSGGGGASRSF
ncbi:MAG: hypothetical protein COV45_04605 [Deltaproteobacteria bacterium CG11_big_fil_rev_8_21_14_0_20_47_16]|nr:MAG: hypothetical protein COV45_04605 [Deltaproteobacteria bacterium CG11_big_fil_rev_8_21_14_0_20_47_16]